LQGRPSEIFFIQLAQPLPGNVENLMSLLPSRNNSNLAKSLFIPDGTEHHVQSLATAVIVASVLGGMLLWAVSLYFPVLPV
jgi:hypothetical protein